MGPPRQVVTLTHTRDDGNSLNLPGGDGVWEQHRDPGDTETWDTGTRGHRDVGLRGHGVTLRSHRTEPSTGTLRHSQLSGKKLRVGTSSSSSSCCSSAASSAAGPRETHVLKALPPAGSLRPGCPHILPPTGTPNLGCPHAPPPVLTSCQPPGLSPPAQVTGQGTAVQEGVTTPPGRCHPLSPLVTRCPHGQRHCPVPAAAPCHWVTPPLPRCGNVLVQGTHTQGDMGTGQGDATGTHGDGGHNLWDTCSGDMWGHL